MRDVLEEAFKKHQEGDLTGAKKLYEALLNRDVDNPQLLYLLGDIELRNGNHGHAITLLQSSLSEDESQQHAWIDLGCAYKAEHYNDLAETSWKKALEFGENCEVLNNMATLYADSNQPDRALSLTSLAIKHEPDNASVHWNMALALLTKGDWKQGWIEHEWRKKVAVKSIGKRDYAPEWSGKKCNRLIVHGEQGIGDEIMYLHCLRDILPFAREVIVEAEPRLAKLVAHTYGLKCFGSMDEAKPYGPYDYQIGMGTLPKWFRNEDSDFLAEPPPYLTADPDLVQEAKELLKDIPRPWIGVSWLGGTKQTRVHHRSISAKIMKDIVGDKGSPISLQYGHLTDNEADKSGIPRFGEWTDGKDMMKLAAMVECMDHVITVCTTLVHLAGALGKTAWIMAPKNNSWRYGQREGDGAMLWYPQHRIYRQKEIGEWKSVIDRVTEDFAKW